MSVSNESHPWKFNAIKIIFQNNKEASNDTVTMAEFINTWGLDNMVTVLETAFSNAFSWRKIAVFCYNWTGDCFLGPIEQ